MGVSEADLLAEIYDDPKADGPRLVYADMLQERGDPRGELIAMQIIQRNPERERALIAQHGRAWLGPLAAVIDLDKDSQTTFERGFLATAELRRGADSLKAVLGAEQWRTVEELRGDDLDVVLADAPLGALCRFHAAIAIELLASIGARTTPLASVERIAVGSFARLSATDREVLARCAGLPKLKELELAPNWRPTIEDVLWLLETPVAARVERVVVRRPTRPRAFDAEEHRVVEAIVNVLLRTRATASSVCLTHPRAPVELVRGSNGFYVAAR